MNFKSKIISPVEKVLLTDKFTHFKEYKASTALNNEKHSLCVVYTPDNYSENHYCHFVCSIKIKGDIKENITVYRIDHVPGIFAAPKYEKKRDMYLSLNPGLFPDVLVPINEKDLLFMAPKQLSSLWIDIDTTGIKPGKHTLEIEFYAENGELLNTNRHSVTIIDAQLPENDLIITQWIHPDCIADYYDIKPFTAKFWKAMDNLIKTYALSGNTMVYTPLFTPPLDTEIGGERTTCQMLGVEYKNGEYIFDFSNLQKWVAICKKHRIKYYEIGHLFTQWGAFHAPKIIAKVEGKNKKIFGWETDSHSEEYEFFIKSLLENLTKVLEELGISENTYFHISDEPSIQHLESYRACSKIMRKYLKGYKIMDAMHEPIFMEEKLLDIPVPFIAKAHEVFAMNPDKRIMYYCGAPEGCMGRALAMPTARTRITGTQFYVHKIEGFLHWGFNFYNSTLSRRKLSPYSVTDGDSQFCAGDPFMIYPAPNQEIYSSIRLNAFRDSIQDYLALKYCESLCGEKAVMAVISELNGGKNLDLMKVPDDYNFAIELRERINKMIAENI